MMAEPSDSRGAATAGVGGARLAQQLQGVIGRAVSVAASLRRAVGCSAVFCLLASSALGIYLLGGGVGGIMKLGLAVIVAAGLAIVLLLAFAWLLLGRVASLEADVGDLSAEVAAFFGHEFAQHPALSEPKDSLGGRLRVLAWMCRVYPKLKDLGGVAQGLLATFAKAAVLGSPLVNLAVLALTVAGFVLPLFGGLLVLLRIWWRSRGG